MAFFKNGKHAGQSFERVAAEDRRYSAWALQEQREGGSQFWAGDLGAALGAGEPAQLYFMP